MSWLLEFAVAAEKTDTLVRERDHKELLASGLLGEVGGVLAEFKKKKREGPAYPLYEGRLADELGDALWYFVRLANVSASDLLQTLPLDTPGEAGNTAQTPLVPILALGAAAGRVLEAIHRANPDTLRVALQDTWHGLRVVAAAAPIELVEASKRNRKKIESRWPLEKKAHPLFDESAPKEEQLPRLFTVDFIERGTPERPQILLRYKDINIGDRITDNITDADAYRYHDIFHFAYAAYLGWSPVLRALLRSKRKSDRSADENQDGARAVIIEEAISAIVFSRAKQVRYFENLSQVDYDLLKSIQEFTKGYEVSQLPVWQWEEAILEGFRAFRQLRELKGGRVTIHLNARQLIVEQLR
ncbi:MazG nucleotide pyrophosphohydrolase domain-containing protein [Stigmatella aurantiaca]|uniref:Pyrophosphatase n=1 Tax=Stigmatella aurantiaca (strain DW4/3-1) TaxID=378806 RepID=Q08VM5_STIAD|nr:MazG nucleotide pyrophosphohydrolase domain-containing protein [Stigmatella aurantiaca]ADO73726.1 pyrophosphatase [Stigmatella aurantiaca DW4/3-1]EAU64527.1 putative pyrophosphatase [Stigmatella aurantiaca DW4/3-1]